MTALRQARESLGWSQARTIRAISALAAKRGVQLPQPEALKRQLSRWENGQVEPGELYRDLFCEAYGRGPDELGLSCRGLVAAVPSALLAKLTSARTATPDTALQLAVEVDLLRGVDRQHGAPAALDQLRALTVEVGDLMHHSVRASVRHPLGSVLADVSTLAGWQALDLGDVEQAWSLHEKAKAAAREAEDLSALVHATAQQAYVLLDVHRPADAVILAQEARQLAGSRVPPLLTAWLSAVEAEARAAAGDALPARRLLDEARKQLSGATDAALPYITLDDAHLSRWCGNILASLGDTTATEDLYTALAAMDPTFTRAGAGLHCGLAMALLKQRDRSQARRHAAKARELARLSGSVRQRRRVEALHLAAA